MDKPLKITHKGEYILVSVPYNEDFLPHMKSLHGIWDKQEYCWWIHRNHIQKVRHAMRDVFGTDDLDGVEVTSLLLTVETPQGAFRKDFTLYGKILSHATSSTSGGTSGPDVTYLQGNPKSGGSLENWVSVIPAGSQIRLDNVPVSLISETEVPSGIRVSYLKDSLDKDALLQERALLIQRIAEIDHLLKLTEA